MVARQYNKFDVGEIQDITTALGGIQRESTELKRQHLPRTPQAASQARRIVKRQTALWDEATKTFPNILLSGMNRKNSHYVTDYAKAFDGFSKRQHDIDDECMRLTGNKKIEPSL